MPTPLPMTQRRIQRLRTNLKKYIITDPATGCMLWRGTHNINSSGLFLTPKGATWLVRHGRKAEGRLLNTCETPKCVNPDHLFEGKWRDARGITGVKRLTPDKVSEIKTLRGKEKTPVKELAARFGICVASVTRLTSSARRDCPRWKELAAEFQPEQKDESDPN